MSKNSESIPKDKKQKDDTESNESLQSLLNQFYDDLLVTFPELKEKLDKGRKLSIDVFVAEYKSVYLSRFFAITQKDDSIFKGSEPLFLLPEVDFTYVWGQALSDSTREIIWKYIQLVLFSLVNYGATADDFGSASSIFEAISPEQLQEHISKTLENLESVDINGEGSFQSGTQDFDAENLRSRMEGMMNGKLGSLAKEIAYELSNEEGIDLNSANPEFLKTMLSNPTKVIKLVKQIGNKLESKISSGEVKESELLEEAANVMDNLESMPGAQGLKDMLSAMGHKGKMPTGGVSSVLKQRINNAKTKERLQRKLAEKNANKNASNTTFNSKSSQLNASNASNSNTDLGVNNNNIDNETQWLPTEMLTSKKPTSKRGKKKKGGNNR